MLNELFDKMSDKELLEMHDRAWKDNKNIEQRFKYLSHFIICMDIELNKRQLEYKEE